MWQMFKAETFMRHFYGSLEAMIRSSGCQFSCPEHHFSNLNGHLYLPGNSALISRFLMLGFGWLFRCVCKMGIQHDPTLE
jgi:hypothetical protein